MAMMPQWRQRTSLLWWKPRKKSGQEPKALRPQGRRPPDRTPAGTTCSGGSAQTAALSCANHRGPPLRKAPEDAHARTPAQPSASARERCRSSPPPLSQSFAPWTPQAGQRRGKHARCTRAMRCPWQAQRAQLGWVAPHRLPGRPLRLRQPGTPPRHPHAHARAPHPRGRSGQPHSKSRERRSSSPPSYSRRQANRQERSMRRAR
mmetsp:Transcript_14692/g.42304  ORF Transcript_14692/g.42304 Transcript_14692/m.42304 type:complete len:205 (-) Transcript_14692:441-1055(-)